MRNIDLQFRAAWSVRYFLNISRISVYLTAVHSHLNAPDTTAPVGQFRAYRRFISHGLFQVNCWKERDGKIVLSGLIVAVDDLRKQSGNVIPFQLIKRDRFITLFAWNNKMH